MSLPGIDAEPIGCKSAGALSVLRCFRESCTINNCRCSKLIQTGLSFPDKLTQTLSSPEATRQLVSSIVLKDEKDGKTYLKIPVENEKVIENVLALFAGVFSQKKN